MEHEDFLPFLLWEITRKDVVTRRRSGICNYLCQNPDKAIPIVKCYIECEKTGTPFRWPDLPTLNGSHMSMFIRNTFLKAVDEFFNRNKPLGKVPSEPVLQSADSRFFKLMDKYYGPGNWADKPLPSSLQIYINIRNEKRAKKYRRRQKQGS